MRDLETGDDQTNPVGCKCMQLCTADRLSDRRQVTHELCWEIQPVIDLESGYDQGVPGPNRIDGEEADGQFVSPDESPRELAVDDAGEQGRHGVLQSLMRSAAP